MMFYMDMKIEKVPLGKLKAATYNPRQLSEKQKKDLINSIQSFGFVEPIVVNKHKGRENTVVGGHQRLQIARELGLKEIPVVYVDLTEKRERELNIRLNKNIGEWDFDILANEFDLEELKEFGFDDVDLKLLEPEPEEDNFDVEANKPKNPKSKKGQIYKLGRHRLMCGDATSKEDVEKLMDGKKADMVFTDPPYGVSYADKNKFLNEADKGNRNQTEIKNDHLSINDTEKLIYEAFKNIFQCLKEYSSYYITAPQGGDLLMMMMMMMKSGLPLRHMIIWAKNNHVLGRTDYNYKHEPILYGWKKRHKFYGNGEFTKSVWEIDKPHSSKLHPTMKPIRLISNAINNSSKPNDVVLDLFGGSGSTLIACEQTDRTCYMMEIDPIYCDVIIKRHENYRYKTR